MARLGMLIDLRTCIGCHACSVAYSVSPAAMAGVQGRPRLAEPVPLVGQSWGKGWRKLAWGRTQW